MKTKLYEVQRMSDDLTMSNGELVSSITPLGTAITARYHGVPYPAKLIDNYIRQVYIFVYILSDS